MQLSTFVYRLILFFFLFLGLPCCTRCTVQLLKCTVRENLYICMHRMLLYLIRWGDMQTLEPSVSFDALIYIDLFVSNQLHT